MKQIQYTIVKFLVVVCVLIPTAFLIAAAYTKSSEMIIGTVVSVAVCAALLPSIIKKRQELMNEAEYDEFGISKKYQDYKKLSKQEREAIDLQKTADMERVMNSSELKKKIKAGSTNPQADMDALIGLDVVKTKMQEMVSRMEFEAEEQKDKKKKKKSQTNSISSRHMVFYGPPGTGKTTVARILTGFLYQYGYIRKNKCVEVDGNYLKAGEDTALKTELVIRQAYDSVLFIDEAYSLMDDPFAGKTAIATLIKQMEDNKDRFVVIFAGYTDEMQVLLHSNPGISSRVKEYFNFDSYSDDELETIFINMAKSAGFSVDPAAYENFRIRIARERKRRAFGNARTVRNILDESIDRHSLNWVRNGKQAIEKYIIRSDDINTQLKAGEF